MRTSAVILTFLGAVMTLAESFTPSSGNVFAAATAKQANAPRHWAFEPVRVTPPPPDPSGWSANPIDQFTQAKRRELGLTPAAPADKRTLVRRIYFDLTGLPPSPSEAEAFAEDASPDAYSRLIEKLLASPQYGERWGRHWLDVARYADTAGDNADYPIPEIHRYRDYVIDAFNADKPYDQFVREQLAGDILAKGGPRERYAEQLIATGFLALSRRYGTGPGELWHLVLEDTIETTGRAFLGMTFRCARCHDHKYDPVTQEDYYAMYGLFASTRYPWAGSEEVESKKFNRMNILPLLPEPRIAERRREYERRIEQLKGEVAHIEKNDPLVASIAALTNQLHSISNQVSELARDRRELPSLTTQFAALQKSAETEKKKLRDKLKPIQTELRGLEIAAIPPGVPAAFAVQEDQPIDACLQVRGEPAERGPVIPRNAPQFLARGQSLNIPPGASGRLQFAEWLTDPSHPLTARVMVNRIWQHHFGRGIVATPSNFGLRGEPPSHPELLDWLASYFVSHNWSIKAVHRLILQSRTYQLSSAEDERALAIDPDNRWLWRHDRRRLDAEALRDAILSVSGNLDLSRPQAHPFPPFQEWKWTQHNPFKTNYASAHRSVYLMTQRFQRHPYLGLFDGPDANISTDVRTVSTVPGQALFLMNNSFVRTQAAALAKRVLAQPAGEAQRIQQMAALAWAREIKGEECGKAAAYLANARSELRKAGTAPDQAELEAWTSYAKILLMANEFLYLD